MTLQDTNHKMVSKDCIEAAYCFIHQKWRIYQHSTIEWQKDDIEYAIASYADSMNRDLYETIAHGKPNFLTDHTSFSTDMQTAEKRLENMLYNTQHA